MNTDKRRWFDELSSEPGAVRDDALDLDLWTIEIDQQADRQTGGPQIIQTLCRMHVFKHFHCLEFNDNKICKKPPPKVLLTL
ncbi:MAG TPA: hypothetical protein VI524_11945 [Anaerolineales bacterium]|nr:hypothetical protein [Anaerolineales bacterium]